MYFTKHIVKFFNNQVCYIILNLFVIFNQQYLNSHFKNLTIFQTLLKAFQLTFILIRYTNSQQIIHANIIFILNNEILYIYINYINNVLIKDSIIQYKTIEELYKIILKNLKIC